MAKLTQRWGSWPGWLAVAAVALAIFYYVTGEDAALPLTLVPQLLPVPVVLKQLTLGPAQLPVPVNGFVVSLTHDVQGPFAQPVAAAAFLGLLALALAGWLAVVSTLRRTAFGVGMAPVIFLLMSLNLDALGVFPIDQRYFLYLTLAVLGGAAYALHAFAEGWRLGRRLLLFVGLVAGLSAVLLLAGALPAAEAVLQLAAYATPGAAVLVGLVLLWVGFENIRALLWFNTQAEEPGSRFGLLPFLVSSLLYLGMLFWLFWTNGELRLWPGVNLDPLVLLLPAVLTAGLGLRQRAPSYDNWVPYAGAKVLYPLVVAAAAGALAYALATVNTPLLTAARDFTTMALLLLGAAFLLYVLINYLPLIQQRLRVYKVVFAPRQLPFYTVYVMAVAGLVMLQMRQGFPVLNLVGAGLYNHLGDLTRYQSEAHPQDFSLALLAERYYAESGDVLDRHNLHAQLGRAALYRFRQERRNEMNALSRAVRRQPSDKVSLRLASLYSEPADLLEALEVLREAQKAQPRSAAVVGDLAQLFTRTSITDSVAFYLDRAEQLAPGSYASRTNQLAFLLLQELAPAAQKISSAFRPKATEPALASNLALLQLKLPAALPTAQESPITDLAALTDLDAASFAQLYHQALLAVRQRRAELLPTLARLSTRPANEPYYEQLVFLQALTQHAVGYELRARQLLAPLAAGTSATSGYYQQLLGMWQLQQGQYATAAHQLALAATNNADAARLARAYALALAGQPDSAQAETRRLLQLGDSSLHSGARTLRRQLAGGQLRPGVVPGPVVGTSWQRRAQQAEQQGRTTEADRYYQQIIREAPFNEAAVLAVATSYSQRRDYTAAYDALRIGLGENQYSVPLLRAYVIAAADAGLTEYANTALNQLRQQLSPAEYAAVLASYQTHQQAHEAAAADFQ